jgi:Transposase
MTKPYSLDLRERVTERVVAGDSVRAVATIFTVSVASVVRWSRRLRRTGSAAGGKPRVGRWGPSGPHSHWRTGLAHGADRGRARGDRARAHDGTRRTRRCRQLWHGLEFHPSRGNELQKKACRRPSKIAPTWRAAGPVGKNIRRGLILPVSSSSMKPAERIVASQGAKIVFRTKSFVWFGKRRVGGADLISRNERRPQRLAIIKTLQRADCSAETKASREFSPF